MSLRTLVSKGLQKVILTIFLSSERTSKSASGDLGTQIKSDTSVPFFLATVALLSRPSVNS